MSTTSVPATGRPLLRRAWLLIFVALCGAAAALFGFPYLASRGLIGRTAQNWVLTRQSKTLFEGIFERGETPFRVMPNEFLVRMIAGRAPGRALDVAMGQGRNALYLASNGWQVTGFDISPSGLRRARQAADRAGVKIGTVESSVDDFNYGRQAWDLVMLIYAPLRYDDAQLLSRIRDSVKPGGMVLVETQVEWQKGVRERVPGDLERGELRGLFPGFKILYYEEAEAVSEWFPKNTLVARLLAKKD